MDNRQLFNNIQESFNDDEIQEIFFRLGLDHEDFHGANWSRKIYSLVSYCRKSDRTDELIAVCKDLRRLQVKWDGIASPETGLAPAKKGQDAQRLNNKKAVANSDSSPEMNIYQYRAFVREQFTIEGFLDFVKNDEYFNEFVFKSPMNASFETYIRELWHYARRRRYLNLLLDQLRKVDPDMFARYASQDIER